MVTVRFYGSLKQFGDVFKLNCKDTAEIVRALTTQIKGLRQYLQNGAFKVRIGLEYIDSRYLEKGMFYKLKDGVTVHFTPVVKGAKKGGVFQMILGVAIIAFTWWNPLGWGAAAVQLGYGMGASMMLGGVAQMLTKTPTQQIGSGTEQDKKASTSFSNLQNMAAQGRIVPMAYGKIRTGSLIISQGVETYDTEI